MRTQIVTCFFNPCGYKTPRDNMQETLRLSQYPIDVVELVYNDAQPEIVNYTGGRHYIVVGDKRHHICWQKEALLNIGISKGSTDYVLVVDGDVLFNGSNWLSNIEDALTEYHVVQPFTMCRSLDPLRNMVLWPSWAATYQIRKNPTWHSKPGYALAFRRNSITPLVDYGIAGGGDLINLCAVTGQFNHSIFDAYSPYIKTKLIEQSMHIHMTTQGELGVVDQELCYLEHGSHEGRQYNSRYRIVRGVKPDVDIIKNCDGIWEWVNTDFNDAMLEFFEKRAEDD